MFWGHLPPNCKIPGSMAYHTKLSSQHTDTWQHAVPSEVCLSRPSSVTPPAQTLTLLPAKQFMRVPKGKREARKEGQWERNYFSLFFKAGQAHIVNMQNACISQLYTSHRGLLQLPWAANMCQQSKHRRLSQHTPKIKSRESRTCACHQLLIFFSTAPVPCGFRIQLPGLCLIILMCGNWEISIAPSQLMLAHITN